MEDHLEQPETTTTIRFDRERLTTGVNPDIALHFQYLDLPTGIMQCHAMPYNVGREVFAESAGYVERIPHWHVYLMGRKLQS